MEYPILKEWADLAAGSIPASVEPKVRDKYESLFYAGAGVVLAAVGEALGSGDPVALRDYLEAAANDLATHAGIRVRDYKIDLSPVDVGPRPVRVPKSFSADAANSLYGESYGKDWEYVG